MQHRLMFVCLGNICRSPMAECIFKNLIEKEGLTDCFVVASAATSNENIFHGVGAPVYPPAQRELKKHGLSCGEKCAVQLRRSDYGTFDLFLCMDDSNVRNTARIFGGDPDGKIKKLLDFTDTPGDDVDDPWYSGDFSTAYSDIARGCKGLLEHLKKSESAR